MRITTIPIFSKSHFRHAEFVLYQTHHTQTPTLSQVLTAHISSQYRWDLKRADFQAGGMISAVDGRSFTGRDVPIRTISLRGAPTPP
jgi:hypothetical protein